MTCRACQIEKAAQPRPAVAAAFGYLTALTDQQLGIDPDLCPRHKANIESAVNANRTVAGLRDWIRQL